MAKLTLSEISSITANEGSAITAMNANSSLIEAALENTLSRDGTSPNEMDSDLDMNTNDILNVGSIDTGAIFINGVDVTAVILALL